MSHMTLAETYATSVENLSPAAFSGGFFEGWALPPTPAEHLELLTSSAHVSLALYGGEVVGFANAISDGVLAAYIPLLEVLPKCRGQGIGTEVLRRLLEEIGPLYMVDIMCGADVLPFYERLGFQPTRGAVLRNYGWRESC